MEFHDIVQEVVIKTFSKKNKYKKTKWLSEEVLQIGKKREAKDREEKESYRHLNAEFQRKTRRYKKAFLNDQCKETEEKNRMGKPRVTFKRIRDTKEILRARWAQ